MKKLLRKEMKVNKAKIENKSKIVFQEFNRKQKERNHIMKVHIENEKKKKKETLDKIIEETHNVEDKSIDQVAQDLIKQSTDLHKRLAERRRKYGYINSCKNAGSKSFFQFESGPMLTKNDKSNISNLPNISIINKEASETEEDESFNMDIFNKLPDTTTSTLNMTAKVATAPNYQRRYEGGEPSLSVEEEESEDEALDENLREIWNECEKVFETLQAEKEEATNQFIEDFTSKKFEKIAEIKAEMKLKQAEKSNEDHKKAIETEYQFKIKNLEKELQKEKDIGLSEIKTRFYRRKQSIMGKLDYEGAKSKLKASINSKNMSFLSTPSSQSFHLSPSDPTPVKAELKGELMQKNYQMKPYKELISPHSVVRNMPKTPNKMVKIDFGLR